MSAYIILALGALFLLAELAFFSFYLLFFGLGFVIVGLISLVFIFSWQYQILAAIVIALILLFFLKKPLQTKFSKSKEPLKENFLSQSGWGVVKEGMIYYKGTLWHYDGDLSEGTRVKIKGVEQNRVILES